MNKISIALVAMLAGLVGGIMGFLGGIIGAKIQNQQMQPQQTIRARAFELLDPSGRVIAYWGIDKDRRPVLAFGSYRPPNAAERDSTPESGDLTESQNQRVALGVLDRYPFLYMRAASGTPGMFLDLNMYNIPRLWMSDETGPRLGLGVEQSDTPNAEDDDFQLRFEPNRAAIGTFNVTEGGKRYVKGMLSVSRDKLKYPYQQ